VFLACHKIDPSGGELFHEIWKELERPDMKIAKQRLAGRPLDSLQPHSEVEARQALFSIIDRAVGQLELIAATHRERAEANARLLPARLAFDDSMEGERLRRYQASCSRTLLRTLDAFGKMHRASADDDIDPFVPASIDECVPVSAVEVEPAVEINPAFAAESTNEPIHSSAPIADNAISQPDEPAESDMQSHCEPEAIRNNPDLTNEPTAPNSPLHNTDLTNAPNAPTSPLHNTDLTNEPNVPTSPLHNPNLTNEPNALTSSLHNPNLTNEPNALTSPHHRGGRKQIESGSHRGDWGKKPETGPNRREERRARKARSEKTERDLTCLLPHRNLLTWKPPP